MNIDNNKKTKIEVHLKNNLKINICYFYLKFT